MLKRSKNQTLCLQLPRTMHKLVILHVISALFQLVFSHMDHNLVLVDMSNAHHHLKPVAEDFKRILQVIPLSARNQIIQDLAAQGVDIRRTMKGLTRKRKKY